jgi:hypothetical protein
MDEEAKRRKSEADEAERFLDEFDSGIAGNIVDDNTLVFDNTISQEDLEKRREAEEERERELVEEASRSAQDLIDSVKNLYGSNIGELDYVKFKTKADANSFTKILYQIEINEEAIRMVMSDLRDVTGSARIMMFKNLSDLQKTEMELLKTKAQYLASIEASLKQITSDVEMDNAIEIEENPDGTQGQLTAKMKGQRELNKMLEQAMEKMKNGEPTDLTNQIQQ